MRLLLTARNKLINLAARFFIFFLMVVLTEGFEVRCDCSSSKIVFHRQQKPSLILQIIDLLDQRPLCSWEHLLW